MKRRGFLKGLFGVAAAAAGIGTIDSELKKVEVDKGVSFDGMNDYVQVPELDTSGWKHVAYTKDEIDGSHLYLNGKKVSDGKINNFRAYNKILTKSEMEALYSLEMNQNIEIWKA